MKLSISRMECDLTNSTLLRNMGGALGHSLLGYKSAIQGIRKLQTITVLQIVEEAKTPHSTSENVTADIPDGKVKHKLPACNIKLSKMNQNTEATNIKSPDASNMSSENSKIVDGETKAKLCCTLHRHLKYLSSKKKLYFAFFISNFKFPSTMLFKVFLLIQFLNIVNLFQCDFNYNTFLNLWLHVPPNKKLTSSCFYKLFYIDQCNIYYLTFGVQIIPFYNQIQ